MNDILTERIIVQIAAYIDVGLLSSRPGNTPPTS
jgi:hypothetical protein